MKKCLSILLFALVCLFAPASRAQVAVTGNLKNLGHANATGSNTFVRFRLSGYGANLPKIVGSNVFVSDAPPDFHPDANGNISGTIDGNDTIDPSGTFYQVCVFFQGINFRCANYLITGTAFNLNSAVPLTVIPVTGTNQLIMQTFKCIVSVAATTWNCTHNFNDAPVTVNAFDSSGRQIFPDTADVSNPNVTVLTFVTNQSGTALISHAGAVSLATNQPNAVLQNPSGGQVIQGPSLNVSAPTVLTGTVICKNFENVRCIDQGNSAGWAGTTIDTWLTAAQTDLGVGGGVIQIAPGNYTYAGSFTLASNVSVIGPGRGKAVLTASNANTTVPFILNGVTNVTLRDFTVDGGCVRSGTACTGNVNTFDLVTMTSTTQSLIDGLELRNALGNGLYVISGNSHDTIRNTIAHRIGSALPAVGASGFAVWPVAGAGNHHIIFDNDVAHDVNTGFFLSPSSNPSNNSFDVFVTNSRSYANANDGIVAFSNLATGAAMRGFRFDGNESYCNGWPASGAGWDATSCPPGLLQTGSTASSSGTGIDLNSGSLDQAQVIGNRTHHNFFEGIDDTNQLHTVVNTSGTTVTWVSGDNFNVAWKPNQALLINGVVYLVSSVAGAQTTLTLTGTAGVQTGVNLVGPTYSRSIIANNYAYANGNGAAGSQGSGFGCICFGDTFIGNTSFNNFAFGFIDQFATFVTHSGDKAYNNNRGNTGNNAGFIAQGGSNISYHDVSADDSNSPILQFWGITWDVNSNSNTAESSSFCGFNGCGTLAVNDTGTNDTFGTGKNRTGPLCFVAGGGTGCVNYGGGAGAFTLSLPALSGTATVNIGSGTATMTTSLINAGTCGSTVTVPATGVLTSDTVNQSFNASVGANPGVLKVNAWPTADNVNFNYCNPTAGSITPSAATINWKVTR